MISCTASTLVQINTSSAQYCFSSASTFYLGLLRPTYELFGKKSRTITRGTGCIPTAIEPCQSCQCLCERRATQNSEARQLRFKHFSPAMLHLWAKFMAKKGDKQKVGVHKMIYLLLKQVDDMNTILNHHPPRDGHFSLPTEEGDKFIKACFTMGQLHKQLSEHFSDAGVKVFNITAKSHCMMHTALDCKSIHPCLVWCYQGESFMRVVQRLLQSCVRGNHAFNAMAKATRHYNLGMQLKYEEEAKRVF